MDALHKLDMPLELYAHLEYIKNYYPDVYQWFLQSLQAERQADARAVCSECRIEAELSYDDKYGWCHKYQWTDGAITSGICKAAPIWERGRAETENIDEIIARWSDQEFFGEP